MDSQRKLVIFLTIFSCLLLPSPYQTKAETSAASSSSSDLLEEICNKTKNPPFCIKILKSDNRTSDAKTVLSIAKIALDLAVRDSKETRDFIKGLVNNVKASWKPALKECVDLYNNQIILCFKSAYSEVEEGEYEKANYDTLAVVKHVVSCNTSLSTANIKIKSVNDSLLKTQDLSNIGDVVTTDLLNSKSPSPK